MFIKFYIKPCHLLFGIIFGSALVIKMQLYMQEYKILIRHFIGLFWKERVISVIE